MLFDFLVVELINKYLGDYVENLDTSQLTDLNFWQGDVVLQNLDLKGSALDDLDLPVKIKVGHIRKLTLKIPWQSLYTEQVVATIDGLYVLAVPNVAIKYDEKKEEKAKQESKQTKLQQIEKTKKLKAEKDMPNMPRKDPFAEKMAAQVIKNLQVQVMNVHVRYEDKYSNPKRPFSIGVSLKELLFQSTDENWKICVIKEAVTQMFKLIKLDSLAVYWNPNSEQFDGKDKATVLSKLISGVADSEKDRGFQYLITPTSSVAHLRLNTRPEINKYTIPKLFMTIVFDNISVRLSKLQFDDVLEMLESFERMNLMNKYRKYRPNVLLKNHAKEWWHYAMNSVLIEDVRNRRKLWSWSYIEQHRKTMKQYREAYVKNLDGNQVSKELQKTLDDCEKVLNVFSINLMRHQAEEKAAKLGAKKAQEKGSGWFGGWFDGLFGGKKLSGDKKEKDRDKFSQNEKSKLYEAIGYVENEADPTLPKECVALRLVTKLNMMSITLNDDALTLKATRVITFKVKDVFCSFGQRPAANAIMFDAKIAEFTVQGTSQNRQSPNMVMSQTKETEQMNYVLDAGFETNPLDGACDTRVRLNSSPLEIIYDAVTINNLVKFFKPPEHVYLQQLTKAAVAKFEQVKKKSVIGLQHATKQRKYTEISVDLQPSYFIIPEKGYYIKDGRALIFDLVRLKIRTSQSMRQKRQQIPKVEELMKRAFDTYNINLDRIQVLFSSTGEEWRVCRKQAKSDMHILEPISIKIVLQKCIFDKDPLMAKIKGSGKLPLIKLNMSDQRLHDLIGLAKTIPLPDSVPLPKEGIFLTVDRSPSKEFNNFPDVELNFEIKKVDFNISQVNNDKETSMLRLVAMSLETKVTKCTYDMNVAVNLGKVYVQHRKFVEVDSRLVNILNTTSKDGLKNLLEVQYFKTNKDGPQFATTYKNIEQKIDVTFTSLEVLLHQKALLHVLELVEKLKSAHKLLKEVVTKTTEKQKDEDKTDEKESEKKRAIIRQPSAELTYKLKFNCEIESFSATLYIVHEDLMTQRYDKAALGKVKLQGIDVSGKQMSDESMEVKVILKDMVLEDSRQHKVNGITRMIQRSENRLYEEESSNMIDVSFTQDCSKDSNVDVKVNNLYICVCLDYLMSLGDFFTKAMPQKGLIVKVVEELPAPPSNCMNIVVKIEKPEIILIEDQLNPNCNCFVLDMKFILKMKIQPESQDMSANATDLQIFSCVFSERGAVAAQILNPCDISFYSTTPYGEGAHMDIATSDLILNLSPATINTMSGISTALASKPGSKAEISKYTVPIDLWKVKKLSDTDFWFLKTREEVELEPREILDELFEEEVRSEQLIASIPTMVIKIEEAVGKMTVPLLIIESSISGEVKDWSSKLSVESTLKLEVAYYNEKLSVWEPLLEPVVKDGKINRWELGLEVVMNDDLPPPPDVDEDSLDIVLTPAKMKVTVFSYDEMQLTMSKTCLEVLKNLGKSFGDAYRLVEPSERTEELIPPFCVHNHTGLEIVLELDKSYTMPLDADNSKVKMTPDKPLNLWYKKKDGNKRASLIKATQEGDEKKLIIQIEQFKTTKQVTVNRAEKRLYQINRETCSGDIWSVIVNTETPIGQKILSIQSMVQIKNHFEIPVEIYYQHDKDMKCDVIKSCGVVDAESNFNVPLHAVYTPTGGFRLKPVYKNYKVSKETVSWRDAEILGTVQLACQEESEDSHFYISVRAEIENVYFEVGDTMSAKSFIFHLSPTVILHNLLPYPITFQLEGTEEQTNLPKGKNTALLNACAGKSNVQIGIPIYEGKEWEGHILMSNDLPELSVLTFEACKKEQQVTQNLGMHCKTNEGCMDISIYSPYWMVNKTEKNIYYKASNGEDFTTHGHENLDIVMFSSTLKTFFSINKTASLKIGTSEWSDKFPLDTVGSSGVVQCKSTTEQTFSIGVKITLSSSGLTKICTFTPLYRLLNTSEVTLLCQEIGQKGDEWIHVASNNCQPFWPVRSGKDLTMKAKFAGSDVETSQFLFNKPHTTLMKLLDQHGGLNVDCQVTESATVITFNEYMDGMATVLLVNHTEKEVVHFHQSGLKTKHELNAQQYQLYTWENATGIREVIWSCGEKKDTRNDLQQDGIGEFFAHSDRKIYWVSFLNGMQRVLLFTEDLFLATMAQEAGELERFEQEINICIQGLGLSLVNDYKQKEVAYIGITSSGIIWEEKRKIFRALNVKTGETLEKGYQKYANELETGNNPASQVQLENKMVVDWKDLMMYKPNKRQIRRRFQEGIWLQYKTSPYQIQLHAKVQKLQLDNQMRDATFQTVLAPTPLAKSIAAESISKPFIELRMMQIKHEHIVMSQFKYFKVLTQEMTLKVDKGFINELIEFFSSSESVSRDQETILMEKDYKKVRATLMKDAGMLFSQEQKSFYDYLHFSPIKVHLSFSLQGGEGDGKQTSFQSDVINIFLQSVGVVLTDVQDVVFKLGYFEREHKFYNQSQMTGELTRHYTSQAIKQMYVLVLGLNVLGNPFGLIRGMSEGIEDLFYEPYQGAFLGPGEFAEGLALGVRSLFGHTVGGAAGAVSKITGALGKGIATLTLDDNYQKKRKEAMNKRPANVREGFARGGKGLVMGVYDGVTGIVMKPIEGAKTEGVGGFIKGLGKGLVGFVARPISGVIDFASSSFEGIKRISNMSIEVKRLRNPRIFSGDKIIRPYNRREADGYMIFQETEKGKFSSTYQYAAHAWISKDGRHVLIITDKRVIHVNRGEIFGHWDAEWSCTWGEIKEIPKRNPKGIEIVLKEKEKRTFRFGSSSAKKDIHIFNPQIADYVLRKIVEAMNRQK